MGFDRIAFVYDFLARLVFGKSMVTSQTHFIMAIPDGAKVLILGGGTGWILTYLLKQKSDCQVWYIDASKEMLDCAQQKNARIARVTFIHGTEDHIPSGIKFNAVITNFFLDLFSNESLSSVVSKITNSLDFKAVWLATDFVNRGKAWQRILLWFMYGFFRITCGTEARTLPRWENALHYDFRVIDEKDFFHGFIKSSIRTRK